MDQKPIIATPMKKETMAEQMAMTIQESIISGELAPGSPLPSEPQLAGQFGVSRAVVRDATRILMARGLVEVTQGRGVFVTQPDNQAFGEALLLALQRVGASAWDVEQFEQILLPEVLALAAANASQGDLKSIREKAEKYIDNFRAHQQQWHRQSAPPTELQQLRAVHIDFMMAVFAAAHNQVVMQLAKPLLHLRNLRTWADLPDETHDQIAAQEAGYINRLVEAVASRDPQQARHIGRQLVELPEEAILAMQRTPVGQITDIPIPLPRRYL